MKKIKYLALISALAITVTACGGSKDKSTTTSSYSNSANHKTSDYTIDIPEYGNSDSPATYDNTISEDCAPKSSSTSSDEGVKDMSDNSAASSDSDSGSDSGSASNSSSGKNTGSSGSTKENSINIDNDKYEQKLISSYNLTYQTKDLDASIDCISKKVTAYKGYIEYSDSKSGKNRNATYTIRIPKDKVAEFFKDTKEIGELMSRSESTEDVTLNYYDAKTYVETLRVKHDRLLELLKKATKLEDIVKLEHEISDVEYQINKYESQLKVLDNKVDYATINLSIKEVTNIEPVEGDGYWKNLGKEFMSSLSGFGEFFTGLFYGIIVSSPYLLFFAVIIFILIKLIKRRIRKSKQRKMEQMEKYQQIQQMQQSMSSTDTEDE